MKIAHLIFLAPFFAQSVLAKDLKFVGVWEGNFGTPIYTKLVFHQDETLTYCEVSSCHYVNCKKLPYSGSLAEKFFYRDSSGTYEFHRISDDEIEARFEHIAGDVSIAYYEPE
jgi:hypothetical protein